jgi:hypothetical protein
MKEIKYKTIKLSKNGEAKIKELMNRKEEHRIDIQRRYENGEFDKYFDKIKK